MQWDITDTVISIHALLAESDRYRDAEQVTFWQFLSTLSLRRATPRLSRVVPTPIFLSTLSLRRATSGYPHIRRFYAISIHALLAESDHPTFYGIARHIYFYPRSPCGERRNIRQATVHTWKFLSTLSLRRATDRRASRQQPAGISIHALLAESDHHEWSGSQQPEDFYPRSPCGERLAGPSGPAFLF